MKARLTPANLALAAVAGAVILAVPQMPTAVQTIAVITASFGLMTLGANVVVGFAGLLDLGYVAFLATGAYAWGILSGAGPVTLGFAGTPFWDDWGFWIVLLLIIAINMVIGVALGSPTLRLRGDYLAIVTLGFGEIVRVIASNLDSVTGASLGIAQIPRPRIPIVDYEFGSSPVPYFYLLLIILAVAMIAISRLNRSWVGRAWIAIREDEVAAEANGVPTLRMKLLAFAIGATTAGMAGVVFAARTTFVDPTRFDILTSFLVVAAVVIGGMGSIKGSLAGAFVIVGIPPLVQLRFDYLDNYRYLAYGALLVAMMIFRPQGLFPSKRRAAELAANEPPLVSQAMP
ncbi:MAG: branched-chain amino acid ABC transporter permease [Actinomycetota bacterium]